MNITVNGKAEAIEPCTIMEYVLGQGLDPQAVVVEHNLAIVKRGQWPQTMLQEGDNLELLSFVGGG